MLSIKESLTASLNVYKIDKLKEYLNDNNVLTTKQINEIEDGIRKGYFKVPYIFQEQAWGIEKVFLPFSNKLFKVVSTTKANTSIQLHPLKSEKYISLDDNTLIYGENDEIRLEKYKCADIKRNTIHSMSKGSTIFEEQDNNLFDKKETIRMYDSLGREVNTPQEYYKYLLPQFKNDIVISDIPNNEYDENKDKFVFIINGSMTIKINNEIVDLKGKEELFYLNKDIAIEKIIGKHKIMNCIYYEVENYEE